jgi:protein gp37
MANKTSIEWTDYNWNFLRGCSRVSEGCRNCYAEGVAARFSGYDTNGKALPYFGLAQMVNGKPRWTGEISFHEDILVQPLRWTKPRKVFVNSMSDLFHEKVTDEMLDKAFAVMALTPQHTYQILTKRPERMLDYFSVPSHARITKWTTRIMNWESRFEVKWPDATPDYPLSNVWLGVSVEDQKTADERIPLLLDVPAALRWISAEPLLGPIDLCTSDPNNELWRSFLLDDDDLGNGLDWVVVGGESGSNARSCDLAWIYSIVSQCKAANVPVFVKQLGAIPYDSFVLAGTTDQRLYLKNKKGGDIDEFPFGLRTREFPTSTTI